MLKISLALAALIAGSAFVTTAQAGGCGGGGGYYRQSYSNQSYARSERRARRIALAEARARANAKAAANARRLAANKAAAEAANVATAETPAPKIQDVVVPFAKKADLEATVVDAVKTASTSEVCRKFSATVGGLVDTPCQ